MSETDLTITITPAALEHIRQQLTARGTPHSALRIGIRGGMCAGYAYALEFEDGEPRTKDRVFQYGDVKVVVDAKSWLFLRGATLDFERTLLQAGLKFLNPQAGKSCGCGESFALKNDEN
jgi:iron-sulfur cluster assembly protein